MKLFRRLAMAAQLTSAANLARSGAYNEAVELFERTLDAARRDGQARTFLFGLGLDNLGLTHVKNGNVLAAAGVYEEALEVWRTLGDDAPDDRRAEASLSLAAVYDSLGRYGDAEQLYLEALEVWRRSKNPSVLKLAQGLYGLGSAQMSLGKYGEARTSLAEAISYGERAGADGRLTLQAAINDLADLEGRIGNYSRADDLHTRAVSESASAAGIIQEWNAMQMVNQGELLVKRGQFAAAGPMLREGLAMMRRIKGEDHLDVAVALDGLTGLMLKIGDMDQAQRFAAEALAIRQKALGEDHEVVKQGRADLGFIGFTHTERDNELELGLLQKQLEALGDSHPESVSVLRQIAMSVNRTGQRVEAMGYLRRALLIQQDLPNSNLHERALCFIELGELIMAGGDLSGAEWMLRDGLTALSRSVGPMHPDAARVSMLLAQICRVTWRGSEALELMEQAAVIDEGTLAQIVGVTSDRQRLEFVEFLLYRLEQFVSLVCHSLASSPRARSAALDHVLRRKAIATEVMALHHAEILDARHTTQSIELDELRRLNAQLSELDLAGAGTVEVALHEKERSALQQKAEELEARLATRMSAIDWQRRAREASASTVAQALPPDSALIEFVSIGFVAQPVPNRDEVDLFPPQYVALVVRAGEPDDVDLIDLGDAVLIEALISLYRKALLGELSQEDRALGALVLPATVESPTHRNFGAALRSQVFDPLIPALNGRTRLLIVPDSDLNELPFEVLPDDGNGYLIDTYAISYLTTGRDILRSSQGAEQSVSAPLIIADPDYDLGAETLRSEIGWGGLEGARIATQSPRQLSQWTGRAARLDGTRPEAESIAAMLGVAPLMGAAAVKSNITGCRSPRVLHVATHGFFLPMVDYESDQDTESLSPDAGSATRDLIAGGPRNPLRRSGLVLAGANAWLQGGNPPEAAGNGILTAEEASQLDLRATELVVLSACETGLGHIRRNEGVVGLRRSFLVAGAQALVLSLWKVPDRSTRELMSRFYGGLDKGLAPAAALREAQLAVRILLPHPRHWGGFVCIGA